MLYNLSRFRYIVGMSSHSQPISDQEYDAAGGYPIGVAATLSGLPVDVIRVWERRYGLPSPARTVGGHRLYSPRDVALLRRAAALRAQGHSAAAACRQTLSEAAFPDQRDQSPSLLPNGPADLAVRLRAAALSLDSGRAAGVLDEASALLDVETLWDRVLAPALANLGLDWEHGSASPAPEHLLTNMVRGRLSALLGAMPRLPASPEVLVGAGPGERHDLPALMLSLLLARAGQRVTFLGAETPADALEDACRLVRPSLVVVSVVLPRNAEDALSGLRRLRDHLPGPRPLLTFGGPAFAQTLPADADVVSLVRLANDVCAAARQIIALP
jgi:DNA-binding transcriptional MerR regulator